jgi:hypothetical protein
MRSFAVLAGIVVAGLASATVPAFAQAHPGVRCVQEQLNILGFDAGTADGLMGGKTRGAATEYLSGETVAEGLPELSTASAMDWCVALAGVHAEVASLAQGLPDDKLIVGKGVSDQQQATIRRALVLAHDFSKRVVGVELDRPVEVYASANDQIWMTQNYLRVKNLPGSFAMGKMKEFRECEPSAEGGYYSMWLCMSSPAWTRGNAETETIGIVMHEYAHNIQFGLVGERGKDCCTDNNAMSVFGPQWLVEGSAEYLRYMLLEELGRADVSGIIRQFEREVPEGVNLADLETRQGFRNENGWNTGIVATHYLLQDVGPTALVVFWTEIGKGTGMREAFESAFGRTTDEFYESFRGSM